MAGQVPWGEACLAMLAMMIVLIFVLIYYCVMPIYQSIKRRKQQEEEQTWENDPRWNGDTFRYMPKLPADFMADKKYSRLAACSRSSSMRENPTTSTASPINLNESQGTGAPPLVKPPNYSDLFDRSGTSSLASSPPRYCSKTPSVEISSSNEMVDQKAAAETQAQAQPATVPKKMKIQKPKKAKKEDQVKIIMDESTADDQEDKK